LTVAAPFGGNGQQISLAAQLSMAIMQNAYQQKQNGAGNNGTSTVTPVSNADNSTEKSSNNVNPDAHLLAGTSPFVKLITTVSCLGWKSRSKRFGLKASLFGVEKRFYRPIL
jgi:hypothetical protein